MKTTIIKINLLFLLLFAGCSNETGENSGLLPQIQANKTTTTAQVGVKIDDIKISNTGGDIDSYSINPSVSNGFTFDTNTGTVSGVPLSAGRFDYTITATNNAGSSQVSIVINVIASEGAPNITPSATVTNATVGKAITNITIRNSGGRATSYSISPAISNGFAFSTSTGTISGTPNNTGTYNYTITAKNELGSDIASTSIVVAVPTVCGTECGIICD